MSVIICQISTNFIRKSQIHQIARGLCRIFISNNRSNIEIIQRLMFDDMCLATFIVNTNALDLELAHKGIQQTRLKKRADKEQLDCILNRQLIQHTASTTGINRAVFFQERSLFLKETVICMSLQFDP